MNLKECYDAFDGKYEEVLGRLPSERIVEKFLLKFQTDDSYRLLIEALQEQDADTAFRMAHTLKGVCQNLGIAPLGEAAGRLCDALRGHSIPADAAAMTAAVTQAYERTMAAITAYRSSCPS